jgi:hypothetical protein
VRDYPESGHWLNRSLAHAFALCLALEGADLQAGELGAPHGYAPRKTNAAKIVEGSEENVAVVFVDRIVNHGDAPLKNVRIKMHAPLKLPQQTIAKLKVEGKYKEVYDVWGAPILVYEQDELPPGKALVGRWTAWATVREVVWNLQQPPASGGPTLSTEEKAVYLRDCNQFALTDPIVRAAAEQAAAGKKGIIPTLEGIFDLVMDRLKYVLDGSWSSVPKILQSGEGSCSEYSYCFVALCRANGIPARYVGGFVGGPGTPFYIDTVYHRYCQAFVPHVGWADFDATRTDGKKDHRLYFGRSSKRMLLTCVGDGGEGSMTGWNYLSGHEWTGEKPKVAAMRVGWWFPQPPPAVKDKVERFRDRLAKASPEGRKAFVREAIAIGHPFVLPWLDDLLYDPSSRVNAAEAFLKIGGDRVLRPVATCLGCVRDAEGDAKIGAQLNAFTGQSFGADQKKWYEWLKSRNK